MATQGLDAAAPMLDVALLLGVFASILASTLFLPETNERFATLFFWIIWFCFIFVFCINLWWDGTVRAQGPSMYTKSVAYKIVCQRLWINLLITSTSLYIARFTRVTYLKTQLSNRSNPIRNHSVIIEHKCMHLYRRRKHICKYNTSKHFFLPVLASNS